MRKLKSKTTSLRLDDYVHVYLAGMPGNSDAEKIRYLIGEGIDYRRVLKRVVERSIEICSMALDRSENVEV